MKIISKYKDYYDYLVGIYGVDDKIILDRTKYVKYDFSGIHTLYICDYRVDFLAKEGRYYMGDSFKEICRKIEGGLVYDGQYSSSVVYPDLRLDPDKANTKHGVAVLAETWNGSIISYPILQELGFNKIMSAHDVYTLLSAWLAPKDVVVDNRSNEEKILSNGFDLKDSFRGKKK